VDLARVCGRQLFDDNENIDVRILGRLAPGLRAKKDQVFHSHADACAHALSEFDDRRARGWSEDHGAMLARRAAAAASGR
jgi:hypothetical protein